MGSKFLVGVITGAAVVVIILGVLVSFNDNSDNSPIPSSNPTTATPTSTYSPDETVDPAALIPPATILTTEPIVTATAVPTNTPVPTDTPTSIPTNTPPPTNTPTATFTASPTATPTQTLAPTNTPTITSTPTNVPTPTPIPQAVVAAPAGFVLLRRGPADTYDTIATLPNGTKLDVLRWVIGKKEWLKVVANSGSVEALEGYVNTASNLVRVNVNLAEIPPIYEFGPKLLEPKAFETRPRDGTVVFTWQGYSLEENQFYSVILVRDDLSDDGACFHWQTTATEVFFKPEDYGCTSGDYHWGVSIATDLSKGLGGDRIWRDDSEFDERNPIGIGIPHSDKPKDGSDSGDRSGSSSGGSVGGG